MPLPPSQRPAESRRCSHEASRTPRGDFYTLPEGLKMPKLLFVRGEWDAQAAVWVATSDDVPGLATESETIFNIRTRSARLNLACDPIVRMVSI